MVASSILAHHACPDAHRADRPREEIQIARTSPSITGTLAVILRRAGKVIAALNAVWIVFANVAEFSNLFDNCWCQSCVLSLGTARAYNVIQATTADLGGMKISWIGGVIMGTGSCFLFIVCIHLLFDARS